MINKKIFSYLIIAVISFVVAFMLIGKNKPSIVIKNTTKVVTDTIRDTIPKPYAVKEIKNKIVKLAIHDTIGNIDSANVDIPITQKTYKDSSYKVVISGYDPTLDSIEIYRKTIYQIKTITKFKDRNRWNIGPVIGYGMTEKGWHPFFGIGITYNLFR